MTLTQDTAIGYVPTLPEEYISQLHDTGQWREYAITHWHLSISEERISNPRRFDASYVAGQVHKGQSSHDPREALRWVYSKQIDGIRNSTDPIKYARQRGWGSEADLLFAIDNSWEFMTARPGLYTPIGGGCAISKDRGLDVYATPRTDKDCHLHGR